MLQSNSHVAQCNPESRFFHNRRTPSTCSHDELRFTAECKLEISFISNCIKILSAHIFFTSKQVRRYMSLTRRLKEILSERVTDLSLNFPTKKMENREPNNNPRRANIRIDLGIRSSVSRTLFTTCRVIDEWPIRCENRCTQMTARANRVASLSARYLIVRESRALNSH